MILKDGYSLVWGKAVGNSCGSGGYAEVTINFHGKPVRKMETCLCGRGCGGYAWVRDDWGYHDTDIEDIRADCEKYYFDVVASICNEACRTDSLICGGFSTEEEALDYIYEHDISEEDYYWLCNENEPAYIEIEVHDALSGRIHDIITID